MNSRQQQKCDLIVLSHLRWDFVFQRPQHLLTRFGKHTRVFFVEEPVFDTEIPGLEVLPRQTGVWRIVPHLPQVDDEAALHDLLGGMINRLISEQSIDEYALWYYTPMAMPFTRHLTPSAVVYDCMDELSLFKGAHPELLNYENELLDLADIVFTGGHSLYEFKKDRHPNVHSFPSSIDYHHFFQARSSAMTDPEDQRNIPRPRMGFFGVIDERMDINLLAGVAKARPDWQFVILGPVVKINPDSLPRYENIHYLGQKSYAELPSYIGGWDVALMPFAKNESTRFISPTKTPEYLAAGRPVVSTSIRDVVRPYGENELVFIADTLDDYVRAIESALELKSGNTSWREKVDSFLAQTSWDKTWHQMSELLQTAITRNSALKLEAS
ncbi:MAG: glycosyltransferase family 1 protein [Bdellovibrionia bacterium]